MRVRLAIDAATDRLSVAADRAGSDPVEAHVTGARSHAGALLGAVEQVLGGLGATPADIGIVAVADGPGSFTGLRVAFAAAKALARDGAVLMTAPSLLVRAAEGAGPGERVLAVAGALRGQVYGGVWRFDLPRIIEPLLPPRPLGIDDLGSLPPVDRRVGDGPAELLQALGGVRPVLPRAAVLLSLIGVPGGAVPVDDWAGFEPDYGRPAEAQAKWEREHGRALPHPGR